MKSNWIKWIALGLTAGMLSVQVPAVAYAEELTDIDVTEEVQEPTTDDKETPDIISEDDEFENDIHTAPAAYNVESTDDADDSNEDITEIQLFINAGPGSWRRTNGHWWYRFEDGSYAKNALYTIGDSNYAFDQSGWMVTGWYKKVFNGEDYWFYLESNGKMHFSWLKLGTKWYYLHPDGGYMISNTRANLFGVSYAFNADGSMCTGWYKEILSDGYTLWYYYKMDGSQHRGWLKLGTTWYYLNEEYSGHMISDVRTKIGGFTYRFKEDGAMCVGWFKKLWANGSIDWYYYDSNGHEITRWMKINGKWYFFNDDPSMGDPWMYADTWAEIDGVDYKFNPDGSLYTGWYKHVWENGSIDWYYYDSNGKTHYGWLKLGTTWYYMSPRDGSMVYDTMEWIDDHRYLFNPNGSMYVGWYKDVWNNDSIDWYYFDANGMGHNGWLQHKNAWYYCTDGLMIQNEVIKIGNSYCQFDSNGKWLGYVNR